MPTLSFYRQQRADGGVRTGLEIDGDTVLHRFQGGKGEDDPALLWFIDIRCQGPRLPKNPEQARQWFLDYGEMIRAGLRELAEELRAGIDADAWPVRRQLPRMPSGVRVTLSCAAARRFEGLRVAVILHELAGNWQSQIQSLREVHPMVG